MRQHRKQFLKHATVVKYEEALFPIVRHGEVIPVSKDRIDELKVTLNRRLDEHIASMHRGSIFDVAQRGTRDEKDDLGRVFVRTAAILAPLQQPAVVLPKQEEPCWSM